MSYRYDQRTEAEFERDIKERTQEEFRLFNLWLDLIEKNTGHRPGYKSTGCGKSGDLLKDKDVSADPDFDVDGYGHIEVKFSKPLITKDFHLKANQVKAYVESGASILMINGADEEQPVFTMLKADILSSIIETCPIINFQGFGSKPSYKIPVSKFIWRSLK